MHDFIFLNNIHKSDSEEMISSDKHIIINIIYKSEQIPYNVSKNY